MKEHLIAFLIAIGMCIFFFGAIWLVEGSPF
jgi:hypothetical protein